MPLNNALAERLPKSIFELRSGTQVILNVSGFAERVQTTFIGHERGKYFLMRLPSINGNGLTGLYDFLYPGNKAKVTYLHEGHIWGFSAEIQHYALRPHPLLFTAFPEQIEAHCLRKESRLECFFPVQAALGGAKVPSMLMDISRSGCRLTLEHNDILNSLQVGDTLALDCAILGAGGEERLVCQVRAVQPHGGKFSLGTAFTDLSDSVRKRIDEYVDTVSELMDEQHTAPIS